MTDKATTYKNEGNSLLQQQKYSEAIDKYTLAIAENPRESVFYANRSLAYIKLNNYDRAKEDIELSIQCNPKYVKAFLRRAVILSHNKSFVEARNDYLTVLKLEPGNKEAEKGASAMQTEIETLDKDKTCITSKVPLTVPNTFAAYERCWNDLDDASKNELLKMTGYTFFTKLIGENITTQMIKDIARVSDDKHWATVISQLPRIGLLRLFVDQKTKDWIDGK
ncbi:HSP70-interacting protein, putative [Entamoeba invadens IP1]|uniref:HSP70-interacting protein, putative n=1 Tax=Entamoeba invadens IP1 TaxID=370355 RepID=A0A0A1U2X9_ENTIV|nr:HSP70-interacting protein, putative [Entamoeba invadens IP1]ELP88407.1 HSP70-interacting protein, putative [Entamoeba invadens IP1]|eukprot:XP_004255178.1 HSP70-interacting protein, putative [Entamoeba invadens IP1]